MIDEQVISLTVNGKVHNAHAEPRMSLADFLRERFGLPGTHLGCEHGVCGSCTVIYEGKAVRSCLMFAVQAGGAEIETIEGLADGKNLHPLQILFSEQRALQCGFCTPGMLMAAIDLVHNNPTISSEDIRLGMSAVLCRCTGYEGIINAVEIYANQVWRK